MDFEQWCAQHGQYLNDNDDAAKVAKLMARSAWDAVQAAERERNHNAGFVEASRLHGAEIEQLRTALRLIQGQDGDDPAHDIFEARAIVAVPDMIKVLQMIDAHYSGSLDHQPAYAKAARHVLGGICAA